MVENEVNEVENEVTEIWMKETSLRPPFASGHGLSSRQVLGRRQNLHNRSRRIRSFSINGRGKSLRGRGLGGRGIALHLITD